MKYARSVRPSLIAAGLVLAFSLPSAASAQATRTWVSGVGDDVNPCSRTAPCKTFAGAISKTAAGGEINCLDPGGFGGVTITKSLSIICDYTEGGVLSAGAGVSGIVINLPTAADTVFLSGLDLNGAGSATNGIRIISGGIVHVQNSIIRNYRGTNGLGMSVRPSGVLQLTVTNSTIADNGAAATGGGILIQPTGAGTVRTILRDVRLQNNQNHQLRVDTTGNTGAGISLLVEDSQLFGGTSGLNINQAAAAPGVSTMVVDSYIAGAGTGVLTAGANTNRVQISNTTITANITGLTQGGTTIINTFGNNRFDGNGTLGTFTVLPIPEN